MATAFAVGHSLSCESTRSPSMAVTLKSQTCLRIVRVLCVIGALGAMTAVVNAQGSRPQLIVQMPDANVTTGMLVIYGQKLLWNNDSQAVVTLAGMPLAVLSATESQVLAQLPSGIVPGTYKVTVSRGPSTVQNGGVDLTIGTVGAAGPQGPRGDAGPRGEMGPQGETGPQGLQGIA